MDMDNYSDSKDGISTPKTMRYKYSHKYKRLKLNARLLKNHPILGDFVDNDDNTATCMSEQGSDTESATSMDVDQTFDIKPEITMIEIKPDITSINYSFDSNIPIKKEVDDLDEPYYNLNTEITIKNEPGETTDDDNGQDLTISESIAIEYVSDVESTETFLSRNPDVFTKFCGFTDSNMFKALLVYVQDDLRQIKEASKYEQLFSVLAKLHKNEDNLYLNKYLFPATYVRIIELLYLRLDVLCRQVGKMGFPGVLAPAFKKCSIIVIFGTLSVPIRTTPPNVSNNYNYVNYLIGYTAFGDVFFVSKGYRGKFSTKRLMHISGALDKLKKPYWILYIQERELGVTQVKAMNFENFALKFNNVKKECTHKIYKYVERVVGRLENQFTVLKSRIPDFMLYNDRKESCFLDKVVFVCCMILNMLPRCTYR